MSRMLSLYPASAHSAEPAGRPRADPILAVVRGTEEGDAVKAHTTAAEACLAAGRFRAARRHLVIALRRAPDDARCRYLLGQAYTDDPLGCDRQAARHYRKAFKLNASEPLHRAALGRALIRIDDTRAGVNVLKRAAEAAPSDSEVLAIVVEGLREAGESALAFQLLTKARFLAPGDEEIRHLWNRTRFDQVAEAQSLAKRDSFAVEHTPTGSARVVPFIRLLEGNSAPKPRIRSDHPSRPEAHVGRILRPYRG